MVRIGSTDVRCAAAPVNTRGIFHGGMIPFLVASVFLLQPLQNRCSALVDGGSPFGDSAPFESSAPFEDTTRSDDWSPFEDSTPSGFDPPLVASAQLNVGGPFQSTLPPDSSTPLDASAPRDAQPQWDTGLSSDDWLSFAAIFDGGYRNTQFYEYNHNVGVAQWDTRVEIWLPPYRKDLAYGPYVRFAGIAATKDPAFENGLLAGPGFGGQIYPFSLNLLKQGNSPLVKALGPLRLFAEYNVLDYWGEQNRWRPNHQIRAGSEYWLATNVNDTSKPWWTEIWAGGWWQSANEFDPQYDAWILAQSFRGGPRIKDRGFVSWISPYVVLESSLTDHPSYYWENRLDAGAGIRVAPFLARKSPESRGFFDLTRFVFYAEYVDAVAFYRTTAPSSVPDHDWRIGINFTLGEWYYDFANP